MGNLGWIEDLICYVGLGRVGGGFQPIISELLTSIGAVHLHCTRYPVNGGSRN